MLWRAGTITVVIMDGLGHGPEAAEAAANGLHELAVPAGADDPLALLGRLDRRLAGGRGAVAAVARMSPDEFTFSGIGNIGARLGSNGASAGQAGRPGLGRPGRPVGRRARAGLQHGHARPGPAAAAAGLRRAVA